jgi:hypothetical protein
MGSGELALGALLSSGPESVRNWFETLKAGRIEPPTQWNLLGLAEGAALRARKELSRDWLRLAVDILEYLARVEGRSGESRILASMHLRAFFIIRMGENSDEALLTLRPIVEWFRKKVTTPTEQALSASANWSALPIQEIRSLRDIKNMLAVFKELDKAGLLEPYPDIKRWLEIRDQLP